MKKNLKLQKIVNETAEKMWKNEQKFEVTSNEDETLVKIDWVSYGTVIEIKEKKYDDGTKYWKWLVDGEEQHYDIDDDFNYIEGDDLEEYIHNLICQISHTF